MHMTPIITRLFSTKRCLRHLTCIFIFVTINISLFQTYPHIIETSRSPILISFDKTNETSILQYFQWKERTIKASPFKTILHDTFHKPSNKTSYLIYEYTKHRQFCRRPNNALIYLSTCPFRNCYFTCNSSLIDKADAILMLFSHLNYKRLEDFNTNRTTNQIWLLWNDEPYSPPAVFNKFLFNWTISYRFNSEVSVGAYGFTYIRPHPMSHSVFIEWLKENYQKRRNQATWFVTNCRPRERLEYYAQLKKYFSISAFGKCIDNQKNHTQNCPHRYKCESETLLTSKFYLAFESTRTRFDYITEKFWRALSYGAIPIVFGPKYQDYQRIAPPNSFIHVDNYSSPQILAQYLNTVSTNPNEYEKYHEWRINYETRYLGQDVDPVRFCELCYKLNMNKDRIWYNDIHKYFLETD